MGVKISEFSDGLVTRSTDSIASVRAGVNTKSTMSTGIDDTNGRLLVGWTSAGALSVNYVNFTNSLTGIDSVMEILGTDANSGLDITTKGSGELTNTPGSTGTVIISATNELRVAAGTTAQRPGGAAGSFRYNSTTFFPEFYDTNLAVWTSLSGGGGGGVLVWTGVAVSTAMVAGNGYFTTGGGALVMTLPVTAAAGTIIEIAGSAAASWAIAQNAGQSVQLGAVTSTVGVGGTVTSANAGDTIRMLCITADTKWVMLGSVTAGFAVV